MTSSFTNNKIIIEQLNWQKVNNLIPVIIQHYINGDVLMLGYMNQEALKKTLETEQVTFYSRSKQRLWTKGETSGNYLQLIDLSADCDNDTLLMLVNPQGPTCHKGTRSCFNDIQSSSGFLFALEDLINKRKLADPNSSYTAKLYHSGTKRIAQKVGEEGVETALAATVHDKHELSNEAADLIFHLLVLLQDQTLTLNDVIKVLKQRNQ